MASSTPKNQICIQDSPSLTTLSFSETPYQAISDPQSEITLLNIAKESALDPFMEDLYSSDSDKTVWKQIKDCNWLYKVAVFMLILLGIMEIFFNHLIPELLRH